MSSRPAQFVFLDAGTLPCGLALGGDRVDYRAFESTDASQLEARVAEADMVITNKVRLATCPTTAATRWPNTHRDGGGAAIDVLEAEPPPVDHVLLAPDIPHLLLTPMSHGPATLRKADWPLAWSRWLKRIWLISSP